MITDEKLLRLIMRTSSMVRRKRKDGTCIKGQGIILDKLDMSAGVTQQYLAEELSIRPQSVSDALSALEEKGFIRREINPNDKRSMLICLTEAGRAAREANAAERAEHAKKFFSVLSDDEKESLFFLLKRLCEANSDKTPNVTEEKGDENK